MKAIFRVVLLVLSCLSAGLSAPAVAVGIIAVRTERVPQGGLQPQSIVDATGVVHLVWFKGKPNGGDLFYARKERGAADFSEPLRVNSEPGSGIAVGTIRGANLALGQNGRVHVAWNGAKSVPGATYPGVPMWYARLDDSGKRFEPQRNLITFAGGLDGGGSVAADQSGRVHVLWHGAPATNAAGEAGRAVFIASSADDGKTFASEVPASPSDSGACGCCGMKAFSDQKGTLFALFRSASTKMDRDEILMASRDGGRRFETLNLSPWKVASCPMSSAAFCETKDSVFAAWETAGQIEFTRIDAATLKTGNIFSPPGAGRRKHPVLATNHRGETLLAWTEGTGWQRGGTLAWQVFNAGGQPTNEKGRIADAIPVWGLPAAVALPDGSFTLFH